MLASRCTFSAVTVPSRRAPSSAYWIWSRPWCADIRLSERDSVYFTGFPVRCAARNAMNSSATTWSLPPKPPPTSGAITRTLCSGMPRISAMKNRRMCGIWVDDHTVSCSPVGSTTTLRGSMKAGMSRCWRYRRRITTSASARAASASPPVPACAESKIQVYARLLPWSACTNGAPSASAASRSTTAGSGS